MAEIVFQYEGQNITIQCNKNQKMLDICNNLSNKINTNLDSLVFLYGGSQLKFDKKYEEITKENKIIILVYKIENENEYCSKCGRILNNKIIDDIISINNNINSSLIGLKIQLDNIINDINNKKDIIYINSQLKNINYIINGMNEDFKKIKSKLEQMKSVHIQNKNLIKLDNLSTTSANYKDNTNNNKADEINLAKNEIICIYNKKEDEIGILHDYNENIDFWLDQAKNSYSEGKKNINESNIEIYINDKKIDFNYKYKSSEKGEIKVLFKFMKLLTNTSFMFYKCSCLESIDLSLFNASDVDNMKNMFYECSSLKSVNLTSFDSSKVQDMRSMFEKCSSLISLDLSPFSTANVENMRSMFESCSSLKSINLSSFNTTNVKDMSCLFYGCSSLISIDLSSFDTINVKDMYGMFRECSSIKSIDLSSFNTTNVNDMRSMFEECSSLKKLNLSSFDITNVKDMTNIFYGCSSLKKNNIKINNSSKKLLGELKSNLI